MWAGISASFRTFYLARKAGFKALKPIQQEIFKFLAGERPSKPLYKRDFIASRIYANQLLVEAGFRPFYPTHNSISTSDKISAEYSADPAHITDGLNTNNIIDNATNEKAVKNLGIIGIPGTGKTVGVLIALSEIINGERTNNEIDVKSSRPKIYVGGDKRQESRFKRFMISRATRVSRNNTLLLPHTIILCPSRETCLSIYNQAQNFELQSLIIAGGYGYKRRSSSVGLISNIRGRMSKGFVFLGENADVIIGTPEMIVRLLFDKMQSYEVDLAALRCLVLFEAHILLDGKDLLKINQIFEMFRNYFTQMPRIYITSVTKTSAIVDFSQKNLQPIHWIIDQSKIGHKQSFISLSGQDRLSRLLQQNFIGKLIVFCNTVKSCQFVYNVLSEKGIKTYLLHGEKSYRERTKGLYSFTQIKNGVLVTTDVFARGYKLGKIDGFISFDFPSNIANYLSRLSVLCRSGGWASTFFAKKHTGLIRQIAEISDKDLMEFQNSGPIYPVAASKPKYTATIKTVNRHVTSPSKKLRLKKMYYKNKIMKNVLFLRSRKLLGKKQLMPRMPDQIIENFDSQEIISMQRSKDGFVQIFPKRRSNMYIRRRQTIL